MRQFVIEVLDTAEQITPEKAFDILTFAFRGEVLSVQERRPTQLAPDAGKSAGLQALSTPEHSATSQNLSTLTQRG